MSGSLDTSIRVWDVESGNCLHTLMGHQSLTSGMELRDNILVSGNADSTVKIWDIKTGQCLQTLQGECGWEGCWGRAAVFLPTGHGGAGWTLPSWAKQRAALGLSWAHRGTHGCLLPLRAQQAPERRDLPAVQLQVRGDQLG